MNQVCLVGRLASEPYKFEGEKYNRCAVTIAINEGKDKALFVRVYLKGGLADYVLTLHKGDTLGIVGHLVVQETKESQNTHYKFLQIKSLFHKENKLKKRKQNNNTLNELTRDFLI